MNEGITAAIPNELKCWQLDAIKWIEQEQLAYLPALQIGCGFGRTKHYIVKDKKHFAVSFLKPYGLMKVDKIYPGVPVNTKGYIRTTYCNLGVMAFYIFRIGSVVPDIKYGGEHYGKHPLSMLAFGCNKTQALIDSGQFNKNAERYGIQVVQIESELLAAYKAHYGDMVFALWANPGSIGHISTIVGGKEVGPSYDFGHAMTYNIGSSNGYMSLESAFCKTKGKDIKFYKVEKI